MRLKTFARCVAAAAVALVATTAGAVNCYIVFDRSDNVIYRGVMPPIDLSDRGQADRDAMRRRGEHMVAMDTDRCIGVEFFTGTAGSSTLTVDQIVGGIAPRGSAGGSAPATAAPAPAGAPASPGRAAPSPSVSSKRTGAGY